MICCLVYQLIERGRSGLYLKVATEQERANDVGMHGSGKWYHNP